MFGTPMHSHARMSLIALLLIGPAQLLGPGVSTAQPFFDAPWRTFETAPWATGRYAVALATGDLNNDDRPDAVIGQNVFSPGLRVFLNQGSAAGRPATFNEGNFYSTPRGAWGVVLADFDGDGDLDVAATDSDANYVGSQVAIFRNNGAGVLTGPQLFPAGGASTGIDAIDLDDDADVDLIVANYGFFGNGTTVSVLRNNGSGTFAAPVSYVVGAAPNDIKAGDLDRDGDADLAVAHDGGSRVSVLFNQGNGTFAPATSFDNLFPGAGPAELVVLDIDGDQDLDILRSGYYDQDANDARLALLRNAGNRVFQAELLPYGLPFRNPAFDLTVADLDGDQRDDVIGAHFFEAGFVVFEDDNAGRFMPGAMYAGLPNTIAVAAPDLDGDADSDVLTTSRIERLLTSHENTGGGTFPELPIQGHGNLHMVIDLGDVDHDGDLDAVTSHGGASYSDVVVYRNQGNGTFVESFRTPANVYAAFAKLRDLGGDGTLDLLFVTAPGPPFATPLDFWSARGNGNGTFGPIVRHPLNACGLGHPAAIDLDDDDDLDVINTEVSACINIPESGRRLFISLNNGDGTFQPAFTVFAGAAPFNVAGGDFNEDGQIDLATASQSISALLFGNGDGTFQPEQPLATGRLGDNILALDLNSDANLDLVSLEDDAHSESVLSVLLGNGMGGFVVTEYLDHPTQDFREWVASGDVDEDGDTDLVTGGVQDALVFLNDDTGHFTLSGRYGIAADAFALHYADVTGDGHGDLVALGKYEFPPAGFDHGLVVVPGLPPSTTGVEPVAGPVAPPRDGLLSWSVLPNPFHDAAHLRLVLAEPQRVTLDVHDVMGRRVQKLHEGKLPAVVEHSFAIPALGLPSGIYFVRLAGETFTRSIPVTIVK
jgi:FG-GAP-like repeat